MAKIEKIGSLYFDGQPQKVGVSYNGEQIFIGDAVPDQEISWVRLQSGILIADRCVCINISWMQLHKKGFVFGVPITIDGKIYLCRCLRMSTKESVPNEWDTALDETSEDNDIWHWKEGFFWGQDISSARTLDRAVRGYYSARYWPYNYATHQYVSVGFRPALEYLGSGLHSPDALLGKKARAYCLDGVTIEGRLVDFSDYDVVLETTSPVTANCSWTTKEGRNIVIDRRNIIWLREG